MCRSHGDALSPAMSIGLSLALVVALGAAEGAGSGLPHSARRSFARWRTCAPRSTARTATKAARWPAGLPTCQTAVANWDRSIRDAELRLRPRIEGASPDEASLAHEALGSAYLERGRFADAVTEFEAASRLAPQRASLHLSRAFALEAVGSPDRAAAAFRQAWTLAPDDPITAYLALARSALDGADLTRVRDALVAHGPGRDPWRAHPGPPSTFPDPAGSMGDSGGAPLFPLARYADGFALATAGRLDEAVARLRETAGSDPLLVDPASQTEGLRQAADALRRGSLRAALVALEKVVAASPGSSEAHRMLATAASLAGDTRASIEPSRGRPPDPSG